MWSRAAPGLAKDNSVGRQDPVDDDRIVGGDMTCAHMHSTVIQPYRLCQPVIHQRVELCGPAWLHWALIMSLCYSTAGLHAETSCS